MTDYALYIHNSQCKLTLASKQIQFVNATLTTFKYNFINDNYGGKMNTKVLATRINVFQRAHK